MPSTCAHPKPNGTPCAARPLPNSDFCLFHDPAQQQSQAESRRKGGAAPRRRFRRFPRLLDHMQVAELLGELFIDSLNDPASIDAPRLQALAALSRVLLRAVGTPPTFLVHSDRREPSRAAGHLLRVYPPLPPAVEAELLAAAPPADSPREGLLTLDAGDGEAWNAAAVFLPLKASPAPRSTPAPPAAAAASPAAAPPEPLPAPVAAPQGPSAGEPALAPARGPRPTHSPSVDLSCDRLLAILNARSRANRAPAAPDAAPLDPPAGPAAASPAFPNTQPPIPHTEQAPNRSGTGLPG